MWAAPIASLLVEKYLTGSISKQKEWVEKRMLDANLINTTEEE
jgi:penicillin-binding protein 2